jgi:DNA-binding beta-propeller fold protein YncE
MILAEGVSDAKTIDKLWLEVFKNSPGPCAVMDKVGLKAVAMIEDTYVNERQLDPTLTVDWLRRNYIEQGKLGENTNKGGLVGGQAKGQEREPTIYFLEMGRSSNDPNETLFGENGRVLRYTGDGNSVTVIVSGLKTPDGLDISRSVERIFWTNMGIKPSEQDGSVMSANLDGSDVRTIIPEGSVHTPKQLTIDDQNRKVYFCDREGMGVHRCDFDGQSHEILVSRGDCRTTDKMDTTRWCVGIAVDTNNEKIYWTQKGPTKANEGRIFRANITMPPGENASNRSDIEILLEGLPEPIDLDIVPKTQMLYWTDRGERPDGDTLNRADVGKASPTVQTLARHFHDPIGLRVDSVHQRIYVTDMGGSVYRFNMDGGDRKVIHCDEGSYTGIALA